MRQMKSPCLGCRLLHEDKNNDVCAGCNERTAYVQHIEGRQMPQYIPMSREIVQPARNVTCAGCRAEIRCGRKFCEDCDPDAESKKMTSDLIVFLSGRGKTDTEISREIGICQTTVSKYRKQHTTTK